MNMQELRTMYTAYMKNRDRIREQAHTEQPESEKNKVEPEQTSNQKEQDCI